MTDHLFPSGVASGASFCNRESERALLMSNIQQVRHTLIMSPRRYGKTSLALKAISEANYTYAYVNFFNALRDEDVAAKFVRACSELLAKLMPVTVKVMNVLKQALRRMQIMIEVEGVKTTFRFNPLSNSPLEIISTLLEDIENLLKIQNKKVVIFLDEFQDILKTEKTDLLQAELRDFVQRAQHVTFIISGSHRHMLSKIFDDKNKPFYKLCNRINLERIKSKDYEEFLQKLAQKKWGRHLSEGVLKAVLELTENHPYYINRLCARLWNQKLVEKRDDVQEAWKVISEEEYDSVVNEISLLSKNQRLVLQAFSQKEYVDEPNSAVFLNESKLPQSSVRQALGFLLKNDFIESTAQGYRVIDPLIKYILNQVSPEKLNFE